MTELNFRLKTQREILTVIVLSPLDPSPAWVDLPVDVSLTIATDTTFREHPFIESFVPAGKVECELAWRGSMNGGEGAAGWPNGFEFLTTAPGTVVQTRSPLQ